MNKDKRGTFQNGCLAFLIFIWRWLTSRKMSYLRGGLLAIAASGILFFLVVEMRRKPLDAQQNRYLQMGTDALKAKDYPQATLCFRRVLLTDPDSGHAKFNLALISQEKGDLKRAIQIMTDLSLQDNGKMCGPASFWLVLKRLQSGMQQTAEQRAEILKLLGRVVSNEPDHLQARLLFVYFYSNSRQWEQAIKHMRMVVSKHPEYYLNLAKLYASQGNQDLAVSSAKSASGFLKSRLKQEPKNLSLRTSLVTALLIQNKFQPAEEILLAGNELAPSEAIHHQLSSLYVRQALQNKKDVSSLITPLKKAIQWNPRNAQAYQLLGQIVEESTQSGKQAIDILEQALVEGKTNPALIHAILGTAFLGHNKYESALKHLEQANQLNPKMPIILNNLALALSKQTDPDLERASELIAIALKQAPNNIQIRESNGQIALRMEKWEKALSEFEYVLPVYRQNKQYQQGLHRLHKAMELAYRKIGNESLASKHGQMVKQLSNNTPAE